MDVDLVTNTRLSARLQDKHIWGLSTNGVYSSQSGYRHLISLPDFQPLQNATLPPIEKSLWSKIWKVKTQPKIRHFLWKALAGALAVSSRLQIRGIQVDTTCSSCRHEPETICHVLFHCSTAREIWERSSIPLPPSGLSHNSVFLNIHYLLLCINNNQIAQDLRLSIPWILWSIWKARNAWVFEKTRLDPLSILVNARQNSDIWLQINQREEDNDGMAQRQQNTSIMWTKPNNGSVKCNVGSSWINATDICGHSWLLRNTNGSTLFHGRSHIHQSKQNLKLIFTAFYGSWRAYAIFTKLMSSLRSHLVRSKRLSYSLTTSRCSDILSRRLKTFLII